MNKTATAIFVFAGIVTLALSAAAYGQLETGPPEVNKKIEIGLEATRLGQQFDCLGLAVKKIENRIETFGVRAAADMPDGTVLEVMVVTKKGEYSVGTIELFLGSGKLELVSSKDPSDAFPVNRIRGVLITYRGQAVLRGQFP